LFYLIRLDFIRQGSRLNREMVRIAMESLNRSGRDFIYDRCFFAHFLKKVADEKNQEMLEQMAGVAAPVILVLNKVDLLEKRKTSANDPKVFRTFCLPLCYASLCFKR